MPAHTLFDAKLDWDPGQHFAALRGSFAQINVQNLANKHYVASCAHNFSCFMGKVWRATASAGYRWRVPDRRMNGIRKALSRCSASH